MLNLLWGFMMIAGILFGAISGNLSEITQATINSSKEAITLCITMLGVVAMWSGMMEVAQGSGLISRLTSSLKPVLHFLFPNLKEDHPALGFIATNMIANIMGLGWAATPAGLLAMKELNKHRTDSFTNRTIATDEMCTFLVINISSLQLIPVNMIAYRSQYGSITPTAIIGPGILATLLSTVVAVIVCKLLAKKY